MSKPLVSSCLGGKNFYLHHDLLAYFSQQSLHKGTCSTLQHILSDMKRTSLLGIIFRQASQVIVFPSTFSSVMVTSGFSCNPQALANFQQGIFQMAIVPCENRLALARSNRAAPEPQGKGQACFFAALFAIGFG